MDTVAPRADGGARRPPAGDPSGRRSALRGGLVGARTPRAADPLVTHPVGRRPPRHRCRPHLRPRGDGTPVGRSLARAPRHRARDPQGTALPPRRAPRLGRTRQPGQRHLAVPVDRPRRRGPAVTRRPRPRRRHAVRQRLGSRRRHRARRPGMGPRRPRRPVRHLPRRPRRGARPGHARRRGRVARAAGARLASVPERRSEPAGGPASRRLAGAERGRPVRPAPGGATSLATSTLARRSKPSASTTIRSARPRSARCRGRGGCDRRAPRRARRRW